MAKDIHQNQPTLKYGTDLENSSLYVILLHGRGATAESMLPLAKALQTEGTHFVIPQAAQNRWYPNTAFGPIEANEPDLTSSLNMIDILVDAARQHGISDQQIAIGGFSQGACLASEYVAQNPRPYATLFMLSGARIGPTDSERDFQGNLNDVPVFIGGSDIDPWVEHTLMEETAALFQQMGANVDFRTYPGMGHTVNEDEIKAVKSIFNETIKSGQNS